MLKNYFKKLLFSLFFLSTSFVFSQTAEQIIEIKKANNTQELRNIEESSRQILIDAKEKALEMAPQKGWAITYVEDGALYELMKVSEDNQPIYYKTLNQNAAISTRVNHLNIGGSLGLELEGQNMTAYVWDGGWVYTNHQEFDGPGGDDRVTIGDDENQYSDHGTHVTGTILASGVNPEAKGMAPQANGVSYRWNSDIPEGAAAAADGMLLSNHSYGYPLNNVGNGAGIYGYDAKEFDAIMYNAPYYLQVVSAGNDGGNNSSNTDPLEGNSQFDKLTGMNTAKNNLSIANGQDADIDANGNLISMNRNNGSSEGPTDDLRIKPDITGNGTALLSPTNDSNGYGSYTGTSMSGPNVMGSLLLVQQHYNNVYGSFMLGATLKGLALHTADDITPDNSNGSSQALFGPDATTGWGLLNTKFAVETINNVGFQSVIKEKTLDNGDTFVMNIKSDGVNPLVASISWTDVAGVQNNVVNDPTPALVNDLDIRLSQVIDGETTEYLPWKLTSVNTNEQGDNLVDPFEKIEIDVASGEYLITISHKGTLVNDSQNYSLIVTGSLSDINLTSINPEIIQCSTSDAEFKFNYTQQIQTTTAISVDNLPTGATASFSPSSISENGEVVMTVANLENVAAGSYDLNVTASNGDETQIKKVELRVVHPDFVDNPMSLSSPLNEEAGVLFPEIELTWNENVNAESYTVELSDNPSFTNIIATSTQTELKYTATGLTDNSVYYWRVNPTNQCGLSISPVIFSFQTAGSEDCTNTYTATDFDNDRLGGGSSVTASLPIEITDDLTISSLKVNVDIAHVAIGELEVLIQEPDALGANTTVLLQNVCDQVANVTGAIFDDNGQDLTCGTSDPAVSGTIKPTQSLSSSAGKSSLGTWLLIANDETFQNGGTFTTGYLESASITICTASANTSVPEFSSNPVSVTAGQTTVLTTSDMSATTGSETASQQVYTIVVVPTKGVITKNGADLAIGGTFTQADVDSGIIAYSNTQTTLFSDSFKVDITNSLNGWLPNQEVSIEATTLSTSSYSLSNVSIYPNPSNGVINVRFETTSNDLVKIELFDLQGRRVYRSNHTSNQALFDESIVTGKLSNGIYILNVSQGNKSTTRRIILSK
jgi:subtilisin-like proprotein convertase family protein